MKNILEKMIYAAASCATMLAVVFTLSSSGAAQNHNPEFSVSNLNFDGSNYILIGEDDEEAYDPRTKLVLKYREGEPEKGDVKLEWVTEQDIEDGSSRVLANDSELGTDGFTDGNGNTSTSDPWEWDEVNLGDYEDTEMFLQGVANDSFAGDVVKLQASHTETVDDYAREFTLLKVDLDIHEPGKVAKRVVGTLDTYELPPEIPEAEQQDPTRCPILVNDDNDDLDLIASGGSVVSPYPKDNDDEVLKLHAPGSGVNDLSDPDIMNYLNLGQKLDDDDVVMITLRKFSGITTGKIKLTTSSNSDVQIFKYTEGEYELDAVDFSELVVDLSNPGTTSPLKDLPNEDVSFYIEGMADNSDLRVQMILEDANDNELARQEVHLQITETHEIGLSVLPHGSLSDATISKAVTRLMQGANRVREDSDGLDLNDDNASPVVFRLSELKPKDTDPTHSDWYQVGSLQSERNAILDHLNAENVDTNIYLSDSIIGVGSSPQGGFAKFSRTPGHFVVAVNNSPDITIAHEWLHAYADAPHVCDDGNLMINLQDMPCSNGAVLGAKTDTQDVSNLEADYAY